jgi:hypothetical protein
MKNITLALDEETIKAGRAYARRHNMTLNSLVRKLLRQTVTRNAGDWIDECFQLMDKAEIPRDAPRTWKRSDLYRG